MTNTVIARIIWAILVGTALVVAALSALWLADSYASEATTYCSATLSNFQRLGCMMAAHEGLSAGLIGAAGALFAGWLAFDAVQEQLRDARESNERQLRAYVLIDKAEFARPDTPEGDHEHWAIHIIFKNFGKTPAYAAKITAAGGMNIPAADTLALPLPSNAETSPVIVIPPEHPHIMRLGGLERGASDWWAAARRSSIAHIWGRIDYVDTFGVAHFTKFQMACVFANGMHQFGFLKHGNETDDFS
jgi:hypothetical protein